MGTLSILALLRVRKFTKKAMCIAQANLRWMPSVKVYALIFSLARATPGTNLLAFCAGIGWLLARWRGALIAVLAGSIPCAAAVVCFTYGYVLWRSNALAMSAIGGMLAAAVGMMSAAAFQLIRAGWRPGNRLRAAVILAAAFGLSFFASVPPIQVLGLGALAGLIWRPGTVR